MKLLKTLFLILLLSSPASGTVEVSPISGGTVIPLIDAATVVWAANQGYTYTLAIAGDRTISNPTDATIGSLYSLAITQVSPGSRLVNWGSSFRFSQALTDASTAPILSTFAGATDAALFYFDGTYFNLISFVKDISPMLYPPANFAATNNQTGKITLSWTDNNTGETLYFISCDDAGFTHSVAAGVTSYEWTVSAGMHTCYVTAYHNETGGTFVAGGGGIAGTSIAGPVTGTSL